MDHHLQIVVGAEMMSMLNNFLGYNQIEVEEKDQHKTTFTTPWGTLHTIELILDSLMLALHNKDA